MISNTVQISRQTKAISIRKDKDLQSALDPKAKLKNIKNRTILVPMKPLSTTSLNSEI